MVTAEEIGPMNQGKIFPIITFSFHIITVITGYPRRCPEVLRWPSIYGGNFLFVLPQGVSPVPKQTISVIPAKDNIFLSGSAVTCFAPRMP